MLGPSVNSTKWNLFLKSLDYWPGALASKWSKTRSWKFKIQTKGLLKIKHLLHVFNLMDLLVLKTELPVTSILQYLKTFNWSQCMSGKEILKYPLSREKRIIKNPHPMPCHPSHPPLPQLYIDSWINMNILTLLFIYSIKDSASPLRKSKIENLLVDSLSLKIQSAFHSMLWIRVKEIIKGNASS